MCEAVKRVESGEAQVLQEMKAQIKRLENKVARMEAENDEIKNENEVFRVRIFELEQHVTS